MYLKNPKIEIYWWFGRKEIKLPPLECIMIRFLFLTTWCKSNRNMQLKYLQTHFLHYIRTHFPDFTQYEYWLRNPCILDIFYNDYYAFNQDKIIGFRVNSIINCRNSKANKAPTSPIYFGIVIGLCVRAISPGPHSVVCKFISTGQIFSVW